MVDSRMHENSWYTPKHPQWFNHECPKCDGPAEYRETYEINCSCCGHREHRCYTTIGYWKLLWLLTKRYLGIR